MDKENYKACPYCAEQVKSTASVCPHCRQWLSICSLRNHAVFIGAIYLWALFLTIGIVVYIHRSIDRGTDFSPYRNQISVLESHMSFETNEDHIPLVYVIAVVTNQTDLAWDNVGFEARFFDKTGTLIGVGEGICYWTLYPKSDTAVLIRAHTLHPFADYASYKINVGSAKDAHSRF